MANWRRDWQYELPSFVGVFSTLGDLAKWDNALREKRVLDASSLEQMWTPARLANGEQARPAYGFGWYLVETGGHRVAEHPGASGIFLMHVIDIPLTIIALTNLDERPARAAPCSRTASPRSSSQRWSSHVRYDAHLIASWDVLPYLREAMNRTAAAMER